jgi:hypothetical protein
MGRTIETEDGTRLEVKEGVVLDSANQTVFNPEKSSKRQSRFRNPGRLIMWRPGPLGGLFFVALIPVVVLVGLTVAVVLAALMLLVWSVRGLARAFHF